MDWQTVVALALVSAAGLALLRAALPFSGGEPKGVRDLWRLLDRRLKTIERPLVKISSGNRSDPPDSR